MIPALIGGAHNKHKQLCSAVAKSDKSSGSVSRTQRTVLNVLIMRAA